MNRVQRSFSSNFCFGSYLTEYRINQTGSRGRDEDRRERPSHTSFLNKIESKSLMIRGLSPTMTEPAVT